MRPSSTSTSPSFSGVFAPFSAQVTSVPPRISVFTRPGVYDVSVGAVAMVTSASVPDMSSRILVVDDSPTIRRVVSAILERHGYEASLASDGEDALEALQ